MGNAVFILKTLLLSSTEAAKINTKWKFLLAALTLVRGTNKGRILNQLQDIKPFEELMIIVLTMKNFWTQSLT